MKTKNRFKIYSIFFLLFSSIFAVEIVPIQENIIQNETIINTPVDKEPTIDISTTIDTQIQEEIIAPPPPEEIEENLENIPTAPPPPEVEIIKEEMEEVPPPPPPPEEFEISTQPTEQEIIPYPEIATSTIPVSKTIPSTEDIEPEPSKPSVEEEIVAVTTPAPSITTDEILKYGDRIRIRFANIKNTTLHTQSNNYTHPDSSNNQIISGYFDINNYKNYQMDEYDDEWIIFGPYPLQEDYKIGQPVKNNDVIRLLNPKTNKKLHYFYNTRYKAPGSTYLLEVCGFSAKSPSNNWQINIKENTNDKNEIILNKTLFTVEALSELNKKYLTISNSTFSVMNKKQQLVGLTEKPSNYWFVEPPDQQPQEAPKKEIITKQIAGEIETIKEEVISVEKIINTMWAINSFDKALFRNNITNANKTGESWSNVSNDGLDVKLINNIAVGPERTTWVIDNVDQLYFKQKDFPWIIIPNNQNNSDSQFLDISVGTNIPKGSNLSVWAIDKNNKIYFRNGTSIQNLQGTNWIEVNFQGNIRTEQPKQISVDPQGNVAILTTQGNLYYKQTAGNRWLEITKTGLNLSEPLKQIKLGSNGNAWLLNKNQKIYFINNIIGTAQAWQEVSDGYLSEIAINSNGTVFGINSNGTLYKRANTQINPLGSGWLKTKENVQKIALLSNDSPMCIDRGFYEFYNKNQNRFSQFIGNKISFLNTNNEWEKVPLSEIQPIGFQSITINSFGQVFALDRFFNSYYRNGISKDKVEGDNWTKFNSLLPLTLELGQTENSSNLWSTNIVNIPQGTKNNITNNNPLGTSEAPNLKNKTIQFESNQNLVCSLSFFNNKYIVYLHDNEQNKWVADKAAKEFKQISIKSLENQQVLWAIDPNNKVFIKSNITPENLQGNNWQEVIGKDIQQIFVSPNGTVWGLSLESHYKYKNSFWLYYRTGITKSIPQGTGWTPINSAVEKLPNTSASFLRYGDKISLCTALNRLMLKNKSGEFIDSQNLLAFTNGATAKDSQTFEIINPLNITDRTLVRYNDPIVLRTNENKYLGIVAEMFLYTQLQIPQNTSRFSFGKISNSIKGNLIEYGTRVKIQANNKFLVIDPNLLNSNLVLKGDTTKDNGLFTVLKPLNNTLPIEQSQIDKIESSITLLLQQINQNLENVFKLTSLPDAQAKNALAQILVALFNSKSIIPATVLNNILQQAIAPQKTQLLTQAQRDYIISNMLGKIPSNNNVEFQPMLITIVNKFNEILRTTNLPQQVIIKFVQIAYENKNLMNEGELNALKALIINVHSNSTFLSEPEKKNFETMINSLGGTVATTTPLSNIQTQQPAQPNQQVSQTPQTQQKRQIIKQQALTPTERKEKQTRRIGLQQRQRGIVAPPAA